jgi:hypothetical protein
MEKILLQSAFFFTASLVVYTMVSPPISLSAGGRPAFDESARVRKGTVVEIDAEMERMTVAFDGFSVSVVVNASTTFHSPNGADAELSFLRDGTAVYVFGPYDKDAHAIEAEKVVMRNAPVTGRKSQSRAEARTVRNEANSSILEDLGLTAR